MSVANDRALEAAYHRLSAQTTFAEFVTALLHVSCQTFSANVSAFADAIRGETWRFESADSVRVDQPMRAQSVAVRFGAGDDLNAPFFDGPQPYALAALSAGGNRYGWLYVYDTDYFASDGHRERFEAFALFAGAVLQNIRSLEAAQRAAVTDALTNLPNRRAIEERIFDLVRQREVFTYVLVDVNDFKSINDTHGHEVGDRALQAVADALCSPKRRDDFVGRLGGDEFVAISTGDGARPLIARARHLLGEPMPPLGPISISAGFATFPTDGDSAKALYTTADKQMYAEKRARQTQSGSANRRGEPPATSHA